MKEQVKAGGHQPIHPHNMLECPRKNCCILQRTSIRQANQLLTKPHRPTCQGLFSSEVSHVPANLLSPWLRLAIVPVWAGTGGGGAALARQIDLAGPQ